MKVAIQVGCSWELHSVKMGTIFCADICASSSYIEPTFVPFNIIKRILTQTLAAFANIANNRI